MYYQIILPDNRYILQSYRLATFYEQKAIYLSYTMKNPTNIKYIDVESCSQTHVASKDYSYILPSEINVSVGSIVIVPFGKKEVLAVVKKIYLAKPRGIKNIRAVLKVIDDVLLPKYIMDLSTWIQEYYVSSPKNVWSTILPSGLKTKSRLKLNVQPNKSLKLINKLNTEQIKASKVINKNKITLLHGITGSGKTEVYMDAINRAYKNNKSAILLVPEIMLTTQLRQRLEMCFANIIVWHSSLSPANRKQLWLKALKFSIENKPVVVLGTRSALFLPLHNLDLIVIDEEHEPSYKQDSTPRYEAQIVAAKIASLIDCKLILGSATPSLRSYYLAQIGKIGHAKLTMRHNSKLPIVEIHKKDINSSDNIILDNLAKLIDANLKAKKQTMLFLNRRGSARAQICNNCGNISSCPNCNVSLRYHADHSKLMCHYCSYSITPKAVCDICSSSELRFIGDGTKKLEQEIIARWPDARIARVDRDNSKLPYLISTFEKLKNGEIDIIVGTQMISRGLDIANLSLVGIVDADSMLSVSDFTSSERTFQLISQVAGRAGRRKEVGKVIIQSSNPGNTAILDASQNNYEDFFKQESASRSKYAYPPYFFLLKLQYENANEKIALQKATHMTKALTRNNNIKVLGPVKYFKRTLSRKTVYQIIIKSKFRLPLQNIARELPANWSFDLDPISIL